MNAGKLKEISAQLEPFDCRVQRLANYLHRAAQAGMGSVLFAVFQDISIQELVEKSLEEKLKQQGYTVKKADAGNIPPGELILRLTESIFSSRDILFIFNLEKAGEDGLNSLNYQREAFVQTPLRTVFFLSESELLDISQKAPDFWVFRHRTVYFPEIPPQAAHFLDNNDFKNSNASQEELGKKLALRKKMLQGLSEDAYDARINLLLEIGKLHQAKGEYDSAQTILDTALEINPKSVDRKTNKISILDNLGQIYKARKDHEKALKCVEESQKIKQEIKGQGKKHHN